MSALRPSRFYAALILAAAFSAACTSTPDAIRNEGGVPAADAGVTTLTCYDARDNITIKSDLPGVNDNRFDGAWIYSGIKTESSTQEHAFVVSSPTNPGRCIMETKYYEENSPQNTALLQAADNAAKFHARVKNDTGTILLQGKFSLVTGSASGGTVLSIKTENGTELKKIIVTGLLVESLRDPKGFVNNNESTPYSGTIPTPTIK